MQTEWRIFSVVVGGILNLNSEQKPIPCVYYRIYYTDVCVRARAFRICISFNPMLFGCLSLYLSLYRSKFDFDFLVGGGIDRFI